MMDAEGLDGENDAGDLALRRKGGGVWRPVRRRGGRRPNNSAGWKVAAMCGGFGAGVGGVEARPLREGGGPGSARHGEERGGDAPQEEEKPLGGGVRGSRAGGGDAGDGAASRGRSGGGVAALGER